MPSGTGLRIGAAALAAAPVGFAAGAVAAGSFIARAEAAGPVLAGGLLGALIVSAGCGFAAARMPPRAARIGTLLFGGASFALLIYLGSSFVSDRIERSRAFDAAYAALPVFELTLAARNRRREPFSELAFEARTRSYAADRPGGWRCRGTGSREQSMALYRGLLRALPAARGDAAAPGCAVGLSWRIGARAGAGCIAADAPLVAAADAMVRGSARRATCAQPEP